MVAVIEKTSDLVSLIQNNKQKGNTVGFVPTMGALHKGHLTLVKKSIKENDLTIVSIFINPTQFNDKKDLAKKSSLISEVQSASYALLCAK